jgi:hypothetical protein
MPYVPRSASVCTKICTVARFVPPNPSLEQTHSGKPRKPAVRHSNHGHTSGLRGSPPRSAQLER